MYMHSCLAVYHNNMCSWCFSKSGEENTTEKIIKKVDCQFITLVDFTPGMLHITTHNLHFIPEPLTTGMFTLGYIHG